MVYYAQAIETSHLRPHNFKLDLILDRPKSIGYFMEFLSSALLSGIVYDLIKTQATISATGLKSSLQNWLLDDTQLEKLRSEIQRLEITGEMSEKAIEGKLLTSNIINEMLLETKLRGDTITQIHSGSGDNIAGNKYN